MKYKTIMVSLAPDTPNDACLAVAGDIAERFQARVIGVAASDLRGPLYFEEGEYAQNLIRQEESAIRRRLWELEAEFRGSVQKRAKSVEWRSTLAMPANYLVQQSRAADILVVGARTETIVDLSAAVDPADVLMRAGRPLLVVPHRGMARFAERAGRVEGREGSSQGRARCAANSRHRQGRHDRRNSGGRIQARGRSISRGGRGSLVARPRHCRQRCRLRTGGRRSRSTRLDRRQRRRRYGNRGRLWTFPAARMGAGRCHAPCHNFVSLCPPFTLKTTTTKWMNA